MEENTKKNSVDSVEKQAVIEMLRKRGFRITRQRERILDVILRGTCTSSKEIYTVVRKDNPTVGFATVYRMVNLLEEIGLISRKNMYRISSGLMFDESCFFTIHLSDQNQIRLDVKDWRNVIQKGLKACGYLDNQSADVTDVVVSEGCEF